VHLPPPKARQQIIDQRRADAASLFCGLHRQPRQMRTVKVERRQLIADDLAVAYGHRTRRRNAVGLAQFAQA